jgi:hypothetical protein
MSEQEKSKVIELMEKLGITGHQLQNVKLGPGVVGRNSSIAWALELVMLAGVICGAYLHSAALVGLSLGGAILVALAVAAGNIYFGRQNPAAALLEGAHFLEFQHMQMTAAKGESHVEIPEPPIPPPAQLPEGGRGQLPEGGGA